MARWVRLRSPAYFYPRPPRGGRRVLATKEHRSITFLSTPSARRATANTFMTSQERHISIHALREEGDVWPCGRGVAARPFLSTPSARRATGSNHPNLLLEPISIHALREEGDVIRVGNLLVGKFLSTPSARRATGMPLGVEPSQQISIHALREEGDDFGLVPVVFLKDFYPRPPRGGRPGSVRGMAVNLKISIHALREEGDSKNRDKISIFKQIVQHSARI